MIWNEINDLFTFFRYALVNILPMTFRFFFINDY